jgi:hypothetical protein
VSELTRFLVGESLPIACWLVAVIELSERFAFYGCQGLFQNYIQRPLDGSLGRGALGQRHQTATALTTFFSLWCYGRSKSTIILRNHSHRTSSHSAFRCYCCRSVSWKVQDNCHLRWYIHGRSPYPSPDLSACFP